VNYDDACYDLAALFLDTEQAATELDRDTLAQAIQDAIEDWFCKWSDAHRDAAQC
jgi:hypothetical protein